MSLDSIFTYAILVTSLVTSAGLAQQGQSLSTLKKEPAHIISTISVIGLGYIGLPTAILAAESGYSVWGVDINENKIAAINRGETSIIEPDITSRLTNVLTHKQLTVSSTVQPADCFVVTVPTGVTNKNIPDLSHVIDATKAIATQLQCGNLVIFSSTIPLGTTEAMAQLLEEISGFKHKRDFFTSHCPERALPGFLFKEIVTTERLIGGSCQTACDLSCQFYATFTSGVFNVTDDKTAEIVKVLEDSSRDVQLAFANQVDAICSAANINPYKAIELANRHPRVHILTPSCGVGGLGTAVNSWLLIQQFPENTALLQVTRSINDEKPYQVIKQLLTTINEFPSKPKVLALGLTYKPNIDDLRGSPALIIAAELAKKTTLCDFIAYDPHAAITAINDLGIQTTNNLAEGIAQADIIVILVKHSEFIALDHQKVFANKIVIDTCGLLYDFQKNQAKNLLKGAVKAISNFENVTF